MKWTRISLLAGLAFAGLFISSQVFDQIPQTTTTDQTAMSSEDIINELNLLSAHESRQSAQELIPLVYEELRARAAGYLFKQGKRSLNPTTLVNEACVRILDQKKADYKSRTHLVAVAALAMKRILIDHARKEKSRGAVTLLEDFEAPEKTSSVDLLDLCEAIEKLSVKYQRAAGVLVFKYFGGLTSEEIEAELSISLRTVNYDLRFARAWVKNYLKEGADGGEE